MIRHWAFFKQADTSPGTFYPQQYIVAGYDNLRDACDAEQAFTEAGIDIDNVRSAPGDFVSNQIEAHREANWQRGMQLRIAAFAGTEAACLEQDAQLARDGGAFLFLYAPDAAAVADARKVFAEHQPLYARRYVESHIERLIDATSAHAV